MPRAPSDAAPGAALRQQHFAAPRRAVRVQWHDEAVDSAGPGPGPGSRRPARQGLAPRVELGDGRRRQSSARSGRARKRAAASTGRQDTLTQMQFVRLGLVPDSDEALWEYEEVNDAVREEGRTGESKPEVDEPVHRPGKKRKTADARLPNGAGIDDSGGEEDRGVKSKPDPDEPAYRPRKKRKTADASLANGAEAGEDLEATDSNSRPAPWSRKNTKTRHPAKPGVAIKEKVEEAQWTVRPLPSPLLQATPRRERIPSSQSPDESPVLSRRNGSVARPTRSPLRPRSSNVKIESVSQAMELPLKQPGPTTPSGRKTARVNTSAAHKAHVNAAVPDASTLMGIPPARRAGSESTKRPSPSRILIAGPTRYADVSLTIPDSDEDEDTQSPKPGQDSPHAICAMPRGAAVHSANHPPRPSTSSSPACLLHTPTSTPTPTLPPLKPLSQATTVDITQPTPRPRLTQALSYEHPMLATGFQNGPSFSSSPVLTRAGGSPPGRDEAAAGGSKRMFATESQLLPDSIMNFELPRLPGWSQESL